MKRSKKQGRYSRPGGGELLSRAELAVKTGESERTIERWARLGVIPKIVIGHRTQRFRLTDVLEKLGKRTVKGGGAR